MKNFDALSEQEILALAISLEEVDERFYAYFAEGLRKEFPATAAVFDGMRLEESGHCRWLIDQYRQKFGEHIPHPAPRCEGIRRASPDLVGPSIEAESRAQPSQWHGRGAPAFL